MFLLKEILDHLGLFLPPMQMAPHGLHQLRPVGRSARPQPIGFDVLVQEFIWIEFWAVAWQTYGPERLQAELREDGFPAGVGRIKRLRKKLRLRCKQVRRFTTTTDSTHALPVAQTVLAQRFVAMRPNQT